MKSKPIYSYVRKFEFGDRDHFSVAKGVAILAALIAWFCGTYLSVPNMPLITKSATALFILCSAFVNVMNIQYQQRVKKYDGSLTDKT